MSIAKTFSVQEFTKRGGGNKGPSDKYGTWQELTEKEKGECTLFLLSTVFVTHMSVSMIVLTVKIRIPIFYES